MIFLIFFFLFVVTLHQSALPLGTPTEVSIEASAYQIFTIEIPSSIESYQDLFITTTPTLDIPTQIPFVTLQASNYSARCYQAENQLEGVCSIPHDELTVIGRSVFTVNLTCVQRCSFMVQAYLNDVFTIQIGKKYKLHAKIDSDSIYELEMQVPEEKFDQITIEAELVSASDTYKGVQMYVNVGNYGALMPNQDHYQYKAEPIHKGIGIDIAKADLPKGTWIKIAILTNPNVEIKLSTHITVDSLQQLSFNKKKYCFLPRKVQKNYVLDLTTMLSSLTDNDINVIVLIYSGFPQIKVSFDSSFQKIIENYGVGGHLNYLLTPTIRKQLNFGGKVYIRAISDSQSYFEVTSSVNPKQFVYMQQALTYISVVEAKGIENYIFDYYYELKQNESVEKYMDITVKLKVIMGSGYYCSRVCNEESIHACLLTNSSQLYDSKFSRQVDELPGNIFIYQSLYEVYLFPQAKQCKINQLKNKTTVYLCRIHMVGYNFNQNGNLEWGLTAYSRANSIMLSQGKPFKDMAYEDSSNFYVFVVPPNITELTVFLTVLSGEARLVTSQTYVNPQYLFTYLQGSDIKTNPNNLIKYQPSELKNKIFIGVQGKSMTEYVVNVAAKRNSRSTLISLIPNVQQFFHANKEALQFKLAINASGEWVVDVIGLIGSIETELTDSSSKTLCHAFSKCIFNATTNDAIILRVKSSVFAKFTINYYPKETCRVFAFGIVNYIEVEPNATECVEYFITSKSLQLSYSSNLLSTFGTHITVGLLINNHSMGEMESHYLTLSKQELKTYCQFANTSMTQNCILTLKISSESQSRTELELSVVDLLAPIPLLDGITLPFSHKNFKKQSGVFFYYYSISNNPPTLFLRSFTYQSFFLSYAWVDYALFTNTTHYDSVFPGFPSEANYKTSFELNLFRRLLQIRIPLPAEGVCEQCVLLLSLHAREDYKQSIFELQVSSEEGSMQLGETIRGSLNKDEFYSYQLQKIETKQKAVLSLQNYKSNQSCYQVIVTQQGSQGELVFNGGELLITNNKHHKISIRSFEDSCKYEVLYWLVDVPIRIIISGLRYTLSLENSSSAYYLYYHQLNQSFHLFQSIRSGYIRSHATPIKHSLQSTLDKAEYLFGTDSIYDDIEITPSNPNFCYECYYLIKVTASPSVSASIGVTDSLTPVQLSAGEVMREKVTNGLRYYQYYTHAAFKVKIGLVYGSINIDVTDLNNNKILSDVLSADRELSFDGANSSEYLVGFLFKLSIKQSATFSLQVIDESKTRLIEGYPLAHNFHSTDTAVFVYTHASNQQFDLLLIIDQDITDPVGITLNVTSTSSSSQERSIPIANSNHLGNIYTYDIPGEAADFHISVTTNLTVRIKLLIGRSKLTYLQPDVPALSRENTIYEIFTGGSPIMLDLYACRGDVHVTASTKYSQVKNSLSNDALSLQHSNVGGHYVIESRSFQREYFAMVYSKIPQQPLYTIFYTKIRSLPYSYFDTIERSIDYKMGTNYIQFSFEVPALLNTKLANLKGEYVFLVGDQGSDFNSLIQCGLGTSLLKIVNPLSSLPAEETKIFKFNITHLQLSNLLKGAVQTYYMGVVLTITFDQEGESRWVKYIYETLQISLVFPDSSNQSSNSSTASFIFFWIVLPLIMGGVIAWYSLRYCLHRFRLMTNAGHQLMEEEISSAPALGDKAQEMPEVKEN